VETAPATESDVAAVAPIHRGLAAKALLPAQHLVDAGYPDADHLVTSRTGYGVDLLGPVHADSSWQARAAAGFDLTAFAIDWGARTVTCPQGKTSQEWKPAQDRHGNPTIHVAFAPGDCLGCAQRTHCTHAATGPRELSLRPEAQHAALQAARQRQTTPEFRAQYAQRAGVEGTLSQGVRAFELRRTRYLGLPKTHLQHLATAAAIDLARLDAWWTDTPRAAPRQAAFLRLLPAA
jgi:transposase